MRYKTFDFGETPIPFSTVAEWDSGKGIIQLTETCAEYSTCSIGIQAIGANINPRFLGGWDTLGQFLYSNVYGTTGLKDQLSTAGGFHGEATNNVAKRLRRVQNTYTISNSYGANCLVSTTAGGGTGGLIYCSVVDCSIILLQIQSQLSGASARVLGNFKGSAEGISTLFDGVTIGGFSDWIDCKNYGSCTVELVNSGSPSLTNVSFGTRAHELGAIFLQSLTTTAALPFTSNNPIRILQEVRRNNPSSLTPTASSQLSLDVTHAHSFRFQITPTNAQVTYRGVLQG